MDPHCESLLQEIAVFLAESGMAGSTFGLRAVNDGKLIERLRTQGSVNSRTMHRVQQFIASQRAAGKAVA